MTWVANLRRPIRWPSDRSPGSTASRRWDGLRRSRTSRWPPRCARRRAHCAIQLAQEARSPRCAPRRSCSAWFGSLVCEQVGTCRTRRRTLAGCSWESERPDDVASGPSRARGCRSRSARRRQTASLGTRLRLSVRRLLRMRRSNRPRTMREASSGTSALPLVTRVIATSAARLPAPAVDHHRVCSVPAPLEAPGSRRRWTGRRQPGWSGRCRRDQPPGMTERPERTGATANGGDPCSPLSCVLRPGPRRSRGSSRSRWRG